jgi:hypothetical protein
MPRPNPLTPEIQAAFLAELRRGTLVVAAAARVGMTVSTLYNRRRRDPAFDGAWTAAAEASFGWAWRERPGRRGGRRWRRVATARRLRFAAGRRSDYIEALGREGDPGAAARAVEVDPRTVRRALLGDPGFERAHRSALERGRTWRARREAEARARLARRLIRVVERSAAALERPASRQEWQFARRRRGWRPDRPGLSRPPPPDWTPAWAMPELKRKIRRIELAGWKRARGQGPPPGGGGAFPAEA